MPEVKNYHLRVTAGPSYDVSTHQLVAVNTPQPIHISSDSIDSKLNVRVQNYRGLPSNSPTTSPYFSTEPHKSDLYSLSFSFTLPSTIPGNDLVFGNDFDHPIKDKLPPGFGTALRIVRWAIDPGLDGDVYADEPYLYGPLLSSINVLRIGDKDSPAAAQDETITEGGVGSGVQIRSEKGVPEESAKRMKHFLDEAKRKDFEFETGREYACDFFNPYLDFNEFSLKLPGFTLPIIKYWDGQPLRYVLKHKTADKSIDTPLLVIMFQLVPNEEVEEEEKKWGSGAQKDEKKTREEHTQHDAGVKNEDGGESHKFVDEGVD